MWPSQSCRVKNKCGLASVVELYSEVGDLYQLGKGRAKAQDVDQLNVIKQCITKPNIYYNSLYT